MNNLLHEHILPYSWVHHTTRIFQELPHLVHIWVNANGNGNGNFRAWPLELNRSKGNDEVIEPEDLEYNLKDFTEVCDASFIKNDELWVQIEEAGKDDFWESEIHWKIFIEASMVRTIDIYKEWYEKMSIKNLMK